MSKATMFAFRNLRLTILPVWLLIICNSCALTGSGQGPEVFYTVPPVTYLREFPGYASQIVAPVYHAEQVTLASSLEDDWCRVQRVEGGQIGWIQRPLLSATPLRLETYYIQVNEVPLRNEPQEEVISRQVLRRGDQVRKLSENQQGWWRVLVEKDKSLGWLPAATAAAYPPEKSLSESAVKSPEQDGVAPSSASRPAPPPYYFVAAATLELHLLPLVSSQVVKVLQFNEKVERVSQSGSAWLKVRYPETGVQGWAIARLLSESPAKTPKTFSPKKKKAPPKSRHHKQKKDQIIQPEDFDPEVM